MDEKEIRDELARQIVEGDRFHVELTKEKIRVLRSVGILTVPTVEYQVVEDK